MRAGFDGLLAKIPRMNIATMMKVVALVAVSMWAGDFIPRFLRHVLVRLLVMVLHCCGCFG